MADDIFVGNVAVGVVPDLEGFNDRVRAEVLPGADDIGEEYGRAMGAAIAESLDLGTVLDAKSAEVAGSAAEDGSSVGEIYGEAFKEALRVATEDMPKIRIGIDMTYTLEQLAELRELIAAELDLMDLKVKIGVSTRGDTEKLAAKEVGEDIEGDVEKGFLAKFGGGLLSLLPFGGGGGGGGGNLLERLRGIADLGRFVGGLGQIGRTFGAGSGGFKPGDLLSGGGFRPWDLMTAMRDLFAGGGGIGGGGGLLGGLGGEGGGLSGGLGAGAGIAAVAPFIGQALGGGGVALLGTAFSALGIIGAVQVKQVRQDFDQLASDAKKDSVIIGQAFVPVLEHIAGAANQMLGHLTPIFASAEKIVAPGFGTVVDAMIKSWGQPQVASSITDVAKAARGIEDAFAPDVPGIMTAFATAFERLGNAVAKNPKAFADMIDWAFHFIAFLIDLLAWLIDVADYIELHFIPAIKDIAHWFEDTWHSVENDTDEAREFFVHFWGDVENIFTEGVRDVGNAVKGEWDRLWGDVKGDSDKGANVAFAPVRGALGIFSGWWSQYGGEVKTAWHEMWLYVVDITRPFFGAAADFIRAVWGEILSFFRTDIQVIEDIWKVFWDILSTVVRIGWSQILEIWRAATGILEVDWKVFWPIIVAVAKDAWNTLVAGWKFAWTVILDTSKIIWTDIKDFIKTILDIIIGIVQIGLDLLSGHWTKAWQDIENLAIQIFNNIKNLFTNTFHDLLNIATTGFHLVYNLFVENGKNLIAGLYAGIKAAISGVGSWIKTYVVDPVVNAVKHFFGISSPSTVMAGLGGNLIQGLLQGLFSKAGNLKGFISEAFGGWPQALAGLVSKGFVDIAKLPEKALSALGSVASKIGGFFSSLFGGKVGSGVSQWAGDVAKALAMLGLPLTLGARVLYQMQTESGGNPNAINLWDINAKMGDPSRGLMQVIGSTFAAYHVPGTSENIYDPLANIAAAINYAMHVYGPSLESGGLGIGTGHGYDAGGWLPPGTSLASNLTGRPELILNAEQMAHAMSGGGPTYIANFDSLTGQAIESHVQSAFRAMTMTQGHLARHGRRS